jgi:mono/diheme cytochrome c family protein
MRHLASGLGLGLGLALCSLALASAAGAAAPGDAANGKRLFLRDRCYTCHGTQGAGGGIAGPRLAPDPLPFQVLLMQLRRPANRMPPYSENVLSDAEAADIYAYLKSIQPGRPAGQIPLLHLSSKPRQGDATPG